MSTEEAFVAAVNLIRGMPKEGPFQPSPDLMLRFYGLYKQATEGKNNQPKPSFWNVVNKAKWDAWKCLGNMPKEEAMKKYVEELKQIVEAMPYSDNVANFMHVLGPFYEAVYDGQGPENLRRINPSPPPSEGADKDHQEDESGYSSSLNGGGTEETESADLDAESQVKAPTPEQDIDDEETIGAVGGMSSAESTSSLYTSEKFYSDQESDDEYKDPISDNFAQSKSYYVATKPAHEGEQLHVTLAVQRLQADLQKINARLDALEAHRQSFNVIDGSSRSSVDQVNPLVRTYNSITGSNHRSLPSWFPFKDMNLATVIVLLSWPIVAQYVVSRLRHRRGV